MRQCKFKIDIGIQEFPGLNLRPGVRPGMAVRESHIGIFQMRISSAAGTVTAQLPWFGGGRPLPTVPQNALSAVVLKEQQGDGSLGDPVQLVKLLFLISESPRIAIGKRGIVLIIVPFA